MKTTTTIAFPPRCGWRDVESALSLASKKHRHLINTDWVLDLSRLERISLISMVRMASLARAQIDRKRNVEITTPAPYLSQLDLAMLRSLPPSATNAARSRILTNHVRRGQMLRALNTSGFLRAALSPSTWTTQLHAPALEVDEYPSPQPRQPYTFIRWLSLRRDQAQEELVGAVAALMAATPLIRSQDMEWTLQFIISELVDNVHEHAFRDTGRPTDALIGMRTHDHGYRDESSPIRTRPALDRYLDWLSHLPFPVTELVVADTGRGLSNTILKAYRRTNVRGSTRPPYGTPSEQLECMRFALSPLGTRHTNPTPDKLRIRGLARIVRLVREQQGAILIRTGQSLGGYICPHRREQWICKSGLPNTAGTVVHVLLPDSGDQRMPPPPAELTPVRRRPHIHHLACGVNQRESLRESFLQAGATSHSKLLCIVTATDWPEASEKEKELFLLTLFRVAYDFGQHIMTALWLPEHRAELDAIVGTIDDARARPETSIQAGINDLQDHGILAYISPGGAWDIYGGRPRVRELMHRASVNAGHISRDEELQASRAIQDEEPGSIWLERTEMQGICLAVGPREIHRSVLAHIDEQLRSLLPGGRQ